jgi:1-acyl-sn-glycerol-3-phosphate acyltransferase
MMEAAEELKRIEDDDVVVHAIYRAARVISRYFDATLHDAERIPRSGAALLVGNHALMGVDSWALLPEIYHAVSRMPRPLGLRSLFEVPGLGPLLRELGAVPGERDSAVALLKRGELVMVYPGGSKDALKGRTERYKLKWEGRTGYAHVACRAGAPVVPIAAIGPDECFTVLTDKGVIPTNGFLNGSQEQPSYKVPLFVPLLKRVPFDFFVGEPLAPPVCAHAPDDEIAQAVPAYAEAVRVAMEGLIARGLEVREARERRRVSGARRLVQQVFKRRP